MILMMMWTQQVSETLVFNPPLIELIVPRKFRKNIAATVTNIAIKFTLKHDTGT